MKRIGNLIKKHKYVCILLLIAFVISIVSIIGYPHFILRGIPFEEYSIFSMDFVKAGIQSFLLWMYVTLLLHIVVCIGKFIVGRVSETIGDIKSKKVSIKELGLVIAGAVAAVIVAVLFEVFWCRVVAGTPASTGGYFNRYRFMFFACTALAVYVIILYARKIVKAFEHLYLMLILLVGFCYAFGLPMSMVSWDEPIHYQRTLNASHLAGVEYTQAEYNMFSLGVPVNYSIQGLDDVFDQLDKEDAVVMSSARTYANSFYQFLAYVPSGTVVGICNLLNLSYGFIYCIGRYVNLIFYAVITYAALKRLKSGKIIMSVIALFPINIFLATCYSYDFFITSLTMLGFAYLIGELQRPEEKLTLKNGAIMVAAFFFGIGTKAIYFPLLLLCLLLPASKFASKKAYLIFKAIIIGAIVFTIASFLMPILFASGQTGDNRGGDNISVGGQIGHVLSHPFAFAGMLIDFLINDYMNPNLASSYTTFFAYLGRTEYATPLLMLATAACCVDRNKTDESVLKPWFRVVTLVLSLGTIALCATSMYLVFTNVGENYINGCQPRYMEPMLFPIAYCLGSGKIRFEGSERMKNIAFSVISFFILFASIWQMCISQYA